MTACRRALWIAILALCMSPGIGRLSMPAVHATGAANVAFPFALGRTFSWAAGGVFQFMVADFSNDGFPDLMIKDDRDGMWYQANHNGSRTVPWFFNTTPAFGAWESTADAQPLAGDFNHDGFVDIATRRISDGIWRFGYHNGNLSSPWYNFAFQEGWSSQSWNQPFTGDFNADGWADIGIRDASTGTWYFGYNNAYPPAPWFNCVQSGNFPASFTWAGRSGENYRPVSGDFNKDGFTDLALRNADNGEWAFAFYDPASGTYAEVGTFTWDVGAQYLPFAGDFDRDGFTDIGLRNGDTGEWRFATRTKVGIAYQTWHCEEGLYAHTQSIKTIKSQPVGSRQWGYAAPGGGQFHWTDAPSVSYACETFGYDQAYGSFPMRALPAATLQYHAEALRDAGIDFVYIDASNTLDFNPPSDTDPCCQSSQELTYPLERLLTVWSGVPGAPRVVPYVRMKALDGHLGDMVEKLVDQLARFPDMQFVFEGRPLVLETVHGEAPADTTRVIDNVYTRNGTAYTVRRMWAKSQTFDGDAERWSLMEECTDNAAFRASNGTIACNQRTSVFQTKIEQVSIVPAYQINFISRKVSDGSNNDAAVPKYGGNTLRRQFDVLYAHPAAKIATITGWNEWMAQRVCFGVDCTIQEFFYNDGAYDGMFVDQYDLEYSRDIEPPANGAPGGDATYYNLMKSCIQNYKKGVTTGCAP